MNELDELPSYSTEEARCWNCGSIKYKAASHDEGLMAKGFFKVTNCTDCDSKDEVKSNDL